MSVSICAERGAPEAADGLNTDSNFIKVSISFCLFVCLFWTGYIQLEIRNHAPPKNTTSAGTVPYYEAPEIHVLFVCSVNGGFPIVHQDLTCGKCKNEWMLFFKKFLNSIVCV